MTTSPSSTVPAREADEQSTRYDRWFRAKIQASRNDPRPSVPHDEAMEIIRKKLAAKLTEQENLATTAHRS